MQTFPVAALGYRSWQVKGGRLYPMFADAAPWRPGPNLAYCQARRAHDAPDADCRCGFNLYHDFEDAYSETKRPGWKEKAVVGAVAAKGQARIHAQGLRVAEAQVLALYAPDPSKVEALAEHYQVPVFSKLEAFKQFVKQLPVDEVPQEQRPEHQATPKALRHRPYKPLRAKISKAWLVAAWLGFLIASANAVLAYFGFSHPYPVVLILLVSIAELVVSGLAAKLLND